MLLSDLAKCNFLQPLTRRHSSSMPFFNVPLYPTVQISMSLFPSLNPCDDNDMNEGEHGKGSCVPQFYKCVLCSKDPMFPGSIYQTMGTWKIHFPALYLLNMTWANVGTAQMGFVVQSTAVGLWIYLTNIVFLCFPDIKHKTIERIG